MLKDGLNCQLSGVFVIFFSDGESTLVDDWWWKKCPIFQQEIFWYPHVGETEVGGMSNGHTDGNTTMVSHMGLTESRVPLDPLVSHHFPYWTAVWKVYPCVPNFQSQPY
jgi:hypothetical protein